MFLFFLCVWVPLAGPVFSDFQLEPSGVLLHTNQEVSYFDVNSRRLVRQPIQALNGDALFQSLTQPRYQRKLLFGCGYPVLIDREQNSIFRFVAPGRRHITGLPSVPGQLESLVPMPEDTLYVASERTPINPTIDRVELKLFHGFKKGKRLLDASQAHMPNHMGAIAASAIMERAGLGWIMAYDATRNRAWWTKKDQIGLNWIHLGTHKTGTRTSIAFPSAEELQAYFKEGQPHQNAVLPILPKLDDPNGYRIHRAFFGQDGLLWLECLPYHKNYRLNLGIHPRGKAYHALLLPMNMALLDVSANGHWAVQINAIRQSAEVNFFPASLDAKPIQAAKLND